MSPALFLALAAPAQGAAPPSAVRVETVMLTEQRTTGADGRVVTRFLPPARAVPGDRVRVVVRYRNNGSQPVSGLVVANPVPAGLVYAGVAPGTPAPEASVDGRIWAPLAQLRVGPGDGARAATAADVRQLRWRVAGALAPGGAGERAFDAVVR